jgi:hypothetical protein
VVGRVVAGVVVALCASVLVVSAHADTPANVFDGAGVFVDNTANYPGPWQLADELQAAHFSWVALHVHNDTHEIGTDPLWVSVLRDHGLKVGGWGSEGSDVLADAVNASDEIRDNKLDFYIADAETSFEQTKKLHFWRNSAAFVTWFRRFQPTIPAALTTYGAAPAPWVIPIDYAAWRNGGFELLPQAYYNQFPKVLRPDMTVAHAVRAGWTLPQVHPVIGVYRRYPAANYVPLLQGLGTEGFSVFIGDQATAADYFALSPLVAGS